MIHLSASAGFRTLSGNEVFDWGRRRGLAGPLISWRIFDGGRIRAEIRAADAGQQSAALGYEKAVLTALADAERALNEYSHALQSLRDQGTALASTRRVAETTRRRYTLGDTSLAEVLDAERELADQHALLAQNKAAATSDLATLFKALGGGWVPRSSPEK